LSIFKAQSRPFYSPIRTQIDLFWSNQGSNLAHFKCRFDDESRPNFTAILKDFSKDKKSSDFSLILTQNGVRRAPNPLARARNSNLQFCFCFKWFLPCKRVHFSCFSGLFSLNFASKQHFKFTNFSLFDYKNSPLQIVSIVVCRRVNRHTKRIQCAQNRHTNTSKVLKTGFNPIHIF
jgi:hypothetical protein